MDCDHQKTKLRLREIAGGRTVNDYQCLVCGHKVGDSVKKNPEITEPWDTALVEQVEEAARQESEIRRAAKVEEWQRKLQDYHDYLKSPAWHERRRLVLERDGYVCRGCLTAPATIVHHLTYDHIMNELLWELTSVCRDCHDRCHPDGGWDPRVLAWAGKPATFTESIHEPPVETHAAGEFEQKLEGNAKNAVLKTFED